MIVALLGILKAGGACLPVDPHYPPERREYMIGDAAPSLVLTRAELAKLTRDAELEVRSLPQRSPGVSSENPVYVIYTSGSTGRPKGVAMPHRAMVNLIEWHRKIFPDARAQRVLQFAALSFDVAFQEIFSTLCTGGTLVMIDEWVRRDARALRRVPDAAMRR